MIRTLLFGLLAISILVSALLATGTNVVLQWPAYGLLGLLGVGTALRWRTRIEHPPSDYCVLAALAFAGYVGWRALTSPYPYLARPDLVLAAGSLITYFVSATLFSNRTHRWALLVVLGGLLAAHFARSMAGGSALSVNGAGGFFTVPNHFCAWLQIVTFLFLGVCIFGQAKVAFKLVFAFLGILGLVTIVLTQSRAGIVSTGLGLITFLLGAGVALWKMHRVHFSKAAIAILVVLLVGLAALFPSLRKAFPAENGRVPSLAAGDFRPGLHDLAIDQWRTSPIWGTGSRTFEFHAAANRPPSLPDEVPYVFFAHSEYHQTLAEYGLVGLLLGLLFLGIHFYTGVRYLFWHLNKKHPATGHGTSTELALVLGVLAGLVAVLGHAFSDFHFHVPAIAILTAYCFGILANPGFDRHLGASVPNFPLFHPLPKLAIVLLGGLLLALTIRQGRSDYYYQKARSLPSTNRGFLQAKTFDYLRIRGLDPVNHEALFFSANNHVNWADTCDTPKLRRAALLRALPLSELCREQCPEYLANLHLLGDILDALGRHDEAESVFLEAVERAPLSARIRLQAGVHYQRVADWDQAEKFYQAAAGPETTWQKEPEAVSWHLENLQQWRGLRKRPASPESASPIAP